MVKAVVYRRLCVVAILLVLALCALGYRLVDLQVLRHDELSARANANTRRAYLLEPRRGEIRDIRGQLLATSLPARTICADPSLIGRFPAEVARTIAPLLQLNEAEVCQRLLPRTRTNEVGQLVTNRYVVLKRKVTLDTWQQVQSAMARLKVGVDESRLAKRDRVFYRQLRQNAIFADQVEDQLRVYPNQKLGAHVLGYVGLHEREINGQRLLETVGMDGIELMLNAQLEGVRGWRVTEKDSRNRELVAFREQDVEPADGLNVVVSLDAGLQHIVETELAEAVAKFSPISASVVVVRPRTGEILALCTLPNFDPNAPGLAAPDQRRNRVIADIAEPGSTFKIVAVSAALNEQTVRISDRFDCEHGKFVYAGRLLHDSGNHGVLTVEEIITESSNIGAAKVGIRLGEPLLHRYIRSFGFSTRTGIPLPGEVSGIVHPLDRWNKLSITRVPMGHETACTPLQMVMAMSAIANGGVLMRPMLVDRLEDKDGNVVVKYQPQAVRQVISEATARQMVAALKTVITAKKGTATKAGLEHYTVAGKTGTAQKAGPGGYMPGKYFSSFIGFFPADRPELCISVVMDEPKGGYFGGQVCAPVFRGIAEHAANHMDIRPDIIREETGPETGPGREPGGLVPTLARRSNP
jgi:cell division protein FtsI/penicillin-binding protein 2